MKGTVIKRGATWSVVIEIGRAADGRRIRRWHSGYRSRKEAERARVELLASLDKGAYVAPSRLSFGSFLVDEWLRAKQTNVKETTLALYELHVTKYVVPRLGGVPLLNLGPAHLNTLYAELLADRERNRGRGLSPTTVRRVHTTLHKALADAVRWGRLARNPADQADPPREATPEMSVWDPLQLRTFLDSVRSDRLFAAWLLAATTGMRRGEILGLRWSDVDLEGGTLSVRQIRTVARYKVITVTPKTERGARTVALDPQTLSALESHRVLQIEERLRSGPEYQDSEGLVFTQPDGSTIHPERFSSWFKQHCQRSGLPSIRLHDVRHSYVTALLGEGVPLKVVSQRVGHSSPMVTMTIYQHVLPGDDRAAAALGANAILGVR